MRHSTLFTGSGSRAIALALAGLLGLVILAAPSSAFADRKSRGHEREHRYYRTERQRSSHHAHRHQHRKYHHYQSNHRIRHLHDNPRQHPYYTPERLGIYIRF